MSPRCWGGAILALVVAAAGCTSLLGDFSAGSGSDGGTGSDAGAEGNASDGPQAGDSTNHGDSGVSDAPLLDQDASGPLQLLNCGAFQNSAPSVLLQIPASDSGGSQGSPIHAIFVEHLASGNARVVVSANGTSGVETAVFTVPENGPGSVTSLVLPSTGLQAETKTAGATMLLLQEYMSNSISYYAIADTDPGSDAAAESPLATISDPPSEGMGQFNAAMVPTTGNQYYTLVSYQTTTSSYNIASWLAPMQTTWSLPLQGQELSVGPSLVAAGSAVYGFFAPLGTGNGSGGPTALQQFTFDPMGTMAPTSRGITSSGETGATLSVGQAPSGQYELAFVTLTGAQVGGVHAGVLDASQINSFMVDDLPSLAFKPGGDAGFFDTTPFGSNNGGPGGRWLSNGDFAIMGTGGTGGSGSMYTGLNFYVGTPTGQWVVETAGTGQNVLPGHTVQSFAYDLQQAVNDFLFVFDLAWTEQLADGSTDLYFNQLKCQL